MKLANELPSSQERLSAMVLEIRSNRDAVERLTVRYTMFRFTGGRVSAEELRRGEMSSYLLSPFGIGGVASHEARRYQELIDEIGAMAERVQFGAEPRTWRQRNDLAGAFVNVSAELIALGSRLEEVMARSMNSDG